MFDHITLRVSDVEASRRFYDTALAPLDIEPSVGDEWGDLSISTDRNDDSVTRRAHVAVAARSHEEVEAFWRAATEAGFRDNGPPGLRPEYHETYYAAFVLDPDGNNIEAVHHGREPHAMLDHVTCRVADLDASRAFYTAALSPLGFELRYDEGGFVGFGVPGNSLWLLAGEPSQNVHVAFVASGNATVDEWHHALLAAGHHDNGPPGERPVYHAGYYGAFVLDPDGNNVEAVCHNR